MDTARREKLIAAYVRHATRFDEIAARPRNRVRTLATGEDGTARHDRSLAPDQAPHGLSVRQRDVLSLVAAGFPNHEIGTALEISVETVKTHVQKTLLCLGARNRAHAVFLACGLGLLQAGPARP